MNAALPVLLLIQDGPHMRGGTTDEVRQVGVVYSPVTPEGACVLDHDVILVTR